MFRKLKTNKNKTYIDVVDVEDFGLEEQAESSGLLDGMSQLTVGLRTGRGNTVVSNLILLTLTMGSATVVFLN